MYIGTIQMANSAMATGMPGTFLPDDYVAFKAIHCVSRLYLFMFHVL